MCFVTELALEQRMLAATFFWRSTNPHLIGGESNSVSKEKNAQAALGTCLHLKSGPSVVFCF